MTMKRLFVKIITIIVALLFSFSICSSYRVNNNNIKQDKFFRAVSRDFVTSRRSYLPTDQVNEPIRDSNVSDETKNMSNTDLSIYDPAVNTSNAKISKKKQKITFKKLEQLLYSENTISKDLTLYDDFSYYPDFYDLNIFLNRLILQDFKMQIKLLRIYNCLEFIFRDFSHLRSIMDFSQTTNTDREFLIMACTNLLLRLEMLVEINFDRLDIREHKTMYDIAEDHLKAAPGIFILFQNPQIRYNDSSMSIMNIHFLIDSYCTKNIVINIVRISYSNNSFRKQYNCHSKILKAINQFNEDIFLGTLPEVVNRNFTQEEFTKRRLRTAIKKGMRLCDSTVANDETDSKEEVVTSVLTGVYYCNPDGIKDKSNFSTFNIVLAVTPINKTTRFRRQLFFTSDLDNA